MKTVGAVHKVRIQRDKTPSRFKPKPRSTDPRTTPASNDKKCFHCGFTNHHPDKCKYKTAKCFRCGGIGHLRSECKNEKQETRGLPIRWPPMRRPPMRQHHDKFCSPRTHFVEAEESFDVNDDPWDYILILWSSMVIIHQPKCQWTLTMFLQLWR